MRDRRFNTKKEKVVLLSLNKYEMEDGTIYRSSGMGRMFGG